MRVYTSVHFTTPHSMCLKPCTALQMLKSAEDDSCQHPNAVQCRQHQSAADCITRDPNDVHCAVQCRLEKIDNCNA